MEVGTVRLGQGGPPERLVRGLVDGPSAVRGVEWHERVTSTNERAAAAAREGRPEVHVVVADEQTGGRGRLGRAWQAPPGTSLLCSWMLRPPSGTPLALVPLMAGLAVAQTAAPHCPAAVVGLKWPNDLLIDGRKAAGILVEAPAPDLVIVGTGINIDWRGFDWPTGDHGLPSEQAARPTSLSEAAGMPVDRWRVFAGLAGVMTRRYAQLIGDPAGLLTDYRRWCSTIGRDVRVRVVGDDRPVDGRAHAVDDDGALVLLTASGARRTLHAGDVEHVRPV